MYDLAPASPSGRPRMLADCAELYDTFLCPNGVTGWIPYGATVSVHDGQITFPVWVHRDGCRGGWRSDVLVEARESDCAPQPVTITVTRRLAVPVTPRIRYLCGITGLDLQEITRSVPSTL
jgi:hypothetical protein